MSGWTCAHRKIWDSPLFAGSALRVGVWQWMIHKAAWKPTKFDAGGVIIRLERGQLCVSQAQICAETGITRKQLRSFLDALERGQAVGQQRASERANAKTIITICNYEEYQNEEKPKGQQKGTSRATQGPTKEQLNNKQEKKDGNFSHFQEKKAPPLASVESGAALLFWADKLNNPASFVAASAIKPELARSLLRAGLVTTETLRARGIAA